SWDNSSTRHLLWNIKVLPTIFFRNLIERGHQRSRSNKKLPSRRPNGHIGSRGLQNLIPLLGKHSIKLLIRPLTIPLLNILLSPQQIVLFNTTNMGNTRSISNSRSSTRQWSSASHNSRGFIPS
ncbi:hypothetical protein VIGAN_05054500, partial [Vigna angularis var. angularis]